MRLFGSSSWLSGIMTFLRRRPQDALGTLWQNDAAHEAFKSKQLNSLEAGPSLRLCVRNHSDEPLLLCWMDQECRPHHFYILESTTERFNAPIVEQDRKETTCVGHAFLIASAKDPEACRQAKSLDQATVIGGYRPSCIGDASKQNPIHLLSIQPQSSKMKLFSCCRPNFRKRKQHDDWLLTVREAEVDSTPIDTSNKQYLDAILGGWPVKMEPEWHGGDTQLRQDLERDLEHATKCLPPHAYQALRPDTPIWINKSLKYGPLACPIHGKGLCFHVDKSWLEDNGCHVEKAKCVELYNIKDYFKDRPMWGRGGVLLHELAHAYHNKILLDGYDNDEIIQCYELAMKEGLYDCVRVHGCQGPECKAYACDNAMEYWAELSTAFLGGKNDSEEYNKWYPFNRKQLKEHDPRAFALLKRLWKVDDC